jgi:hypothetical protein
MPVDHGKMKRTTTILVHGMLGALVLLGGGGTAWAAGAAPLLAAPQRQALTRSVETALAFLRQAPNPDGSFGTVHQHYQTGLAILAFLSAGHTPAVDPQSPIPKACQWLMANSRTDGFLGDNEHPLESHAICGLALQELAGMVPDAKLNSAVGQAAGNGVRYSLRAQDKGVDADFSGGWRGDFRTKVNDRLVTAWFLMQLKSAALRGQPIPDSVAKRALRFLEQSQKVPESRRPFDKLDTGGFSHDAEGLPVVAVTSAGLAVLSLYDEPVAKRDLALTWLGANPPIWYGPNFYAAHFFGARGMVREAARGHAAEAQRYIRRVWELLRDHQEPDGSFQIPPGNAEHTVQMGKPYATALAVLILDSARNLLPVDASD